ncbi:MAG TPA: NnrS family protein [Pseudomonadales bacterium]
MSSALFSIGFRPFYLGAAVFATLAVPAWYGAYAGWLPFSATLPGLAWHAHEMVFGFAPAVIGGFLLTAVRAWTGRMTPAGATLAALFGVWVLGRVLMLTGPAPLAVAVDLAYLPLLALALAVPLWQARNRRNAFVVPLLLTLALLSATHHGAYRGWVDPLWAARSQTVAMDLVAMLLAVIGGRVTPAFSANAIRGLQPKRWPLVEGVALGGLALVILLDLTGFAAELPAWLLSFVFVLAALAHLVRWLGWQPWKTRSNVLLLVLPLGYLWLPVHLLLRASVDVVPGLMSPLALHALSVGAMAGLMLAMMTRSALGHTGRPLAAGPAETFMFAAIHLAALARVFGPLLWPAGYVTWVGLSAALWVLAFGAFAISYAPIVSRPRVDAATA